LRPSTISAIVVGVVIALGGATFGVLAFIGRGSHKPWFYWISPLLAIGFLAVMAQLVVMYWVKVGRLEVRGRPKK